MKICRNMSMAGQFSDGFLQQSSVNDVSHKVMYSSSFLYVGHSSKWHFSRKELEINSPSRKDGIDGMKEEELRAQYCSFIQKLGMELKMPQLTISTAIVFCHWFYLRQSHSKNSWETVATACVFLASKVEETPCLLDKVVNLAYKMIHGESSFAAQKVHLREVFAKQKELILMGERLLLATIGFDFNIQHPYKPLVVALKKLKLQNVLTKTAWNFVNDWLRSSLCLQYKPPYIAAGSLYLAAKLNSVELPSQKGSAWWQEFDVVPTQLQEVIQHMIQQIGFKTVSKPQGETSLVNRTSSTPFACEQGKTTDTQLSAKESSSPDSVLSLASLESTSPKIKRPSEGGPKLADLNSCNGSGMACSTKKVESRCQHMDIARDMVDDCEGLSGREGNVDAKTGRTASNEVVPTSVGLDLLDRERIRAKLKRRRRWERENEKVTVSDVSMEDSLVSEIESGIEVGAPDHKVAKLES